VTAASILQRLCAATARAVPAPLARGPADGGQAIGALPGRVAASAVFTVFDVGKFTNHASGLASFKAYHLPAPDPFVLPGRRDRAGWRTAPAAAAEMPSHTRCKGRFRVFREHE